jgi:hypothetical protein
MRAGDKVLATTLAVLPGGSGAPASALQALERAAAAAATPLAYQPEELLQLIAEHLRASGLSASAETLTGRHSIRHVRLRLRALESSCARDQLVCHAISRDASQCVCR